jgi:TRAP-type C4-dicarboxylate transport system substrate-binding protein
MRHLAALTVVLLCAPSARGEPITLRFGTAAPDGTGWARELNAFARDVEVSTRGAVRVRWYFGGIVGDEDETLARIGKGQLEGVGSGGMACERVMPSVRVTRLLGLFQSREEATAVAHALVPTYSDEAQRAGFALLEVPGMGPDLIFSRTPVRSMADLRSLRFWRWKLDTTGNSMVHELGVSTVPLGLDEGAAAYDKGQIDGFLSIPTAALVFQWSTRARYVSDLRTGFLYGCLIVASRAFDRIPLEHQQSIRSAATKLAIRWDDYGARTDDALLGHLFGKQGLKLVTASEAFRAEFFQAARRAREKLGEKLVPRALLDRVLSILVDYRAEHPSTARAE